MVRRPSDGKAPEQIRAEWITFAEAFYSKQGRIMRHDMKNIWGFSRTRPRRNAARVKRTIWDMGRGWLLYDGLHLYIHTVHRTSILLHYLFTVPKHVLPTLKAFQLFKKPAKKINLRTSLLPRIWITSESRVTKGPPSPYSFPILT